MTDQQHTLVDPPPATVPAAPAVRPADDGIRLPMERAWEVTAWAYPARPGDIAFRLYRDGIVMPSRTGNPGGGDPVPDGPVMSAGRAAELVEAGALVPAAVSALAPLIREVTRFRKYCELVEGPEECALGECEHIDEDGERIEDCPTGIVLATGADFLRLRRVKAALTDLDHEVVDHALEELESLRAFANTVRAALTEEDPCAD